MSCFSCFICHNTVHSDTNLETREKYKELVGMKLCSDSHLCHICSHLLRKFWLFKSICLRRSMDYPILFSDRGSVNLQHSQIDTITLCPDTEECQQLTNTTYHECEQLTNTTNNFTEDKDINHVSLEDRTDILIDTEENDQNFELDNDNYMTEYDNEQTVKANNEDIEKTSTENRNEIAPLEEDKPKEELNKNNDFYKIVFSVEEQKAELEGKRREDKYLEAEFKCYNCAMAFLFKDTYQAHMMRHEESNGEHLCPICLLRFASARVLRAHAAAHGARYACARCGAAVSPRRRAAHRARCAGHATAVCHLCSDTFVDGNALQQHIKRFHLSKTSNKTYPCHVCGKLYHNQAAVRTHMIKHLNRKFPCAQCGARLSSPYSLAAHARAHAPAPAPAPAHAPSSSPAPAPAPAHRCAPCRRVYRSAKSLRAHLRNAQCHQPAVHSCQICSKTCATPRALASHVQTVHSTIKKYGCNLCGARYTSNKSLGAHMRRHRVEPKKVLCHLCGASFQGTSKLNRHLRSVCEKNKLEEELSAFYNQQ